MRVPSFLSVLFLSTAAATAIKRETYDPDFSGSGNLFLVPGKDLQTQDPSDRVGCLTNAGRFVTDTTQCGVFTLQENQPLRSPAGPCNFNDPTAEPGRPQAPQGYAFKCSRTTPSIRYIYSLVSSNALCAQP